MIRFTEKEEEIMQILWNLKKGFVKDIIEEMQDPKPHYNTVSTIIRIMEDKGFVGHKAYGKTYEYYPLITKEKYKSSTLGKVLDEYFSGSYKDLVSFFAKEEKISSEELNEILKEINKNN